MEKNCERKNAEDATEQAQLKRAYRTPQLTEYGSVEDLVDAGVVGVAPSIPSITPQTA